MAHVYRPRAGQGDFIEHRTQIPLAALPAPEARMRDAVLGTPGPISVRPIRALAVAAVVDKCEELLIGHRILIDLEGGNIDHMFLVFVVPTKACAGASDSQSRGARRDLYHARANWRRRNLGVAPSPGFPIERK